MRFFVFLGLVAAATRPTTRQLTKQLQDARLVELYTEQQSMDAEFAHFAPNLFQEFGLEEEMPMIGTLQLGRLFSRRPTSLLFEVANRPDLFVKYQVNCDVEHDQQLHTLFRDFWFAKKAAQIGVGPEIFFISPPSVLPQYRTAKTNFWLTDEEWDHCIAGTGWKGTVRFMVMARESRSLDELRKTPPNGMSLKAMRADGSAMRVVSGMLRLQQAVIVGIQTIVSLEKFHNAGSVHGDIHAGNLVVSRASSNQLKLIDFGVAAFVGSKSNRFQYGPFSFNHPWLSHWEIEGHAISRRSDLFRVLLTMSSLVCGDDQTTFLMNNNANIRGTHDWKARGDLFQIPGSLDLVAAQAPEDHVAIRGLLTSATALVRDIGVDAEIPYRAVVNLLVQVGKILKASEMRRGEVRSESARPVEGMNHKKRRIEEAAQAQAEGATDTLVEEDALPTHTLNRVPYSSALLASWKDPRIRDLFLAQYAHDRSLPESAEPRLLERQLLTESVSFGEEDFVDIQLVHANFAEGTYSRIFRVRNHNLLVKYQASCYVVEDSLHPLFRDYTVMNLAAGAGVAPRAIYLSPPSDLPIAVTPKTAFQLDPVERRKCALAGGSVRFLLMEDVGRSLQSMVPFSLRDSLVHAQTTIGLLRDLFEQANLIHADIHYGNLVLDAEGNLKLIDFEMAIFPTVGAKEIVNDPAGTHPARTFWEMRGSRLSLRTDVLKTLLMVLHLRGRWDHLNKLPSRTMMDMQTKGNFLETEFSPNSVAMAESANLIRYVGQLAVDDVPDWARIIGSLQVLIDAVDAETSEARTD